MPFMSSLPSATATFPTYLFPPLPFRRRSNADTAVPANSTSSTTLRSPSSTPPPTYLGSSSSHLRCSRCLADLCLTSQIISKGFTGRHGRAYLVAPPPLPQGGEVHSSGYTANLPNTHLDSPVPRQLVTGAHTVSDVRCAQCGSVLGWKYVAAEEESQRYKVGKFILETKRVCKAVSWENESPRNESKNTSNSVHLKADDAGATKEEDIEFDSQDEDECEDLFAGVWTSQLAQTRRKRKAFLSRKAPNDDMV